MTDRDVIALALRENRTHNSLSDIEAAAILAALADAGRMIVPREPTEGMINAGMEVSYGPDGVFDVKLRHQAMIDAALNEKESTDA